MVIMTCLRDLFLKPQARGRMDGKRLLIRGTVKIASRVKTFYVPFFSVHFECLVSKKMLREELILKSGSGNNRFIVS
jgi:hypothetical protein